MTAIQGSEAEVWVGKALFAGGGGAENEPLCTVTGVRNQCRLSQACLLGFVHLTQAMSIWEEGASAEKAPPSDWPGGDSVGTFSS